MAPIILILAGAVLHLEFVAMRHLQRASLHEAQSVEVAPPVSSLEDLLIRAAAEIRGMFDLRACWFEAFPFDALLPRIERGRIVLPTPEPGIAPCSDAGVELPIRLDGLTLGRFVLLPKTPTVGVNFPPSAREQAIARAADLGTPLGHALMHDGVLPSRAFSTATVQRHSPSTTRRSTTARRHH